MKDDFDGVIVDQIVALKSKMLSMEKIDGKECNTTKGVSIATEFTKFKQNYQTQNEKNSNQKS